ncbi:MAG: Hsp70 family protein [Cyanobacteria bacterium NC_groundwater_1444_Ag_S-0.65um_54_12]|nr:Hsp70 family protein [Cyanobacteria bacterium NC_groundwater_1444_Ag_S-0.65um_54_12]
MQIPIGIDLGTTNSLIAGKIGDRIAVLPNAEGKLLTPSVVALLSGGDMLVGQQAIDWAERCPQDMVSSVKRSMGSLTKFALPHGELTPVTASAAILRKVIADAERYLATTISDVVITVPAYFNARQREDTANAADLAGLRVLRILNEPTAAALTFGLGNENPQTVVVWDLGGGTFDVSVLRIGYGVYQVLAVDGDQRLGGDDWDQAIAHWLRQSWEKTGVMSWPEPELAYRLRLVAEHSKRLLSEAPTVEMDIANLALPAVNELPSNCLVISRQQFQSLTAHLCERLVAPTERALRAAGLVPANVERVILAGGATRMPAVQELAMRLFGQPPDSSLHPDLVVATGAALQAAILVGGEQRYTLIDVVPFAVGIATEKGMFTQLIPANSPIPTQTSRIFTNARDDQGSVFIQVLQGEHPRAADNENLGYFELPIPPLPRGMARIEVSFELDASGILHISAQDLLEDLARQVEIVNVGKITAV